MIVSLRQDFREKEGSVLVLVLVLIVVTSMLVGTVMVVHTVQYRFIRQDTHRLQARYAAEAAVYVAIDSLQRNAGWNPSRIMLDLPEGMTGEISVAPFGGYLMVRSKARRHRSVATVRALIGAVPPASFQHAVYLWDTASSLNVAGSTRIAGTVVVGERGLRERTFKGHRFTGSVEGAVHPTPALKAPPFEGGLLAQAVVRAEALLHAAPVLDAARYTDRTRARFLPDDHPMVWVEGDLLLSPSDSLLLTRPLTVVATGSLHIQGPLRFKSFSRFIAGKTLQVDGAVAGRHGLFYGRERVTVAGLVACAGQFFSQRTVHVAGDTYLTYPSLLYVAGEAADLEGRIEVEGPATVDGILVHPPLDPVPAIHRGRIIIGHDARVRGAIYNGHETELHGTLYGTLMSYQLYFYDAPTGYVNWLKDAEIIQHKRPLGFLLPVGFGMPSRLSVQDWDAFVEEPVDGEDA